MTELIGERWCLEAIFQKWKIGPNLPEMEDLKWDLNDIEGLESSIFGRLEEAEIDWV